MEEEIIPRRIHLPILFLIFNRPDTTARVFERIRQIRPTKLYVAADGPRMSKVGEKERCDEAREVINGVDWDCEVQTLYRTTNLGCKIAVSEAISWFFDCEEYGVILEDDCLPDLSFFPYCEELLLRYKDDQRIGHISGNCFFPNVVDEDLSYDFCSITHIWGWASWSRVWRNYDVNFPYWTEANKDKCKRKSLFTSLREEIYFSSFLPDILDNKINTWDIQYVFMLRVFHMLSIYPKINMVTNIGLQSADATHTLSTQSKRLFVPSDAISFPLKHPKYLCSNRKIDSISARNVFSVKRLLRYYLKYII